MSGISIRWRLTIWYTASLAVLLVIFGGLIDGLMRERLLSRTDFELDEELHELELEVKLAQNHEELLQQLQLRFNDHKTFEFQVLNSNGSRFFASRGLQAVAPPVPEYFQGQDRQFSIAQLPALGDSRVASQQVSAHDGQLIVQSVLPLGRYMSELHDLRKMMLSAGPLMLLAAVGGGYWMARRSLQPVDRMTRTVSHTTAVRLNERLAVDNPRDELGQLAAAFNHLLDRLQHAISELRQFTADAAHEFRTPLAVIRSTSEVALHSPRDTEYYKECLQSISEETARLTSLSNQLLVLAREDAGVAESSPEPVELDRIIDQVAADLEPLADEKSLSIQCRLQPGVLVMGEPQWLRRVFLNLLDNAIRYTPDSGEVVLQLSVDNDFAVGTVADTGPGIGAEHLPHLFERFYRVDASRNRDSGGAGLGLAISHAIVERHGGRLKITSLVGKGTTARVELPVCSGDRSTDSQSLSSAGIHSQGQ